VSKWWSGGLSFVWHLAVGPWFIVDVCCESICSICLWVFIATHWRVTYWSSLEFFCGLLYQSMCKQTFNMLTQIEVVWSI
jgi:hypothetical protein